MTAFSAFKAKKTISGKRIMVLGGAGFIGSHLCEALLQEGPEKLTVIDNRFLGTIENMAGFLGDSRVQYLPIDANVYAEIAGAFKQRYDLVYNLAVLPLVHSLAAPELNIAVNTAIPTNLCELQRHGAFETLIHFSSSEVYGSAQYEPMDERHPMEPSTPYAAAKAAGDLIVLSYAKTFGIDVAILRPFNAYGPRQNMKSYAGIIPLTIQRVLTGEPIEVYGDGSQTRDYSYVTDIADAAVQMYKCLPAVRDKVVNIGAGRETAIILLAMLISQLMTEAGYPERPIVFTAPRQGDIQRHIANVYRAEDLLGYNPTSAVPLTEGMRRTVQWYLTPKPKGAL